MQRQLVADPPQRTCATVTDLASRRGNRDYIESITLMFDGVDYGTLRVRMPYAKSSPIVLYVVPSHGDAGDVGDSRAFSCLITNDPSLGAADDIGGVSAS